MTEEKKVTPEQQKHVMFNPTVVISHGNSMTLGMAISQTVHHFDSD